MLELIRNVEQYWLSTRHAEYDGYGVLVRRLPMHSDVT
jgi:hypothetical protein